MNINGSRESRKSHEEHLLISPLASYSLRKLKFSSSQPTLSYRVGILAIRLETLGKADKRGRTFRSTPEGAEVKRRTICEIAFPLRTANTFREFS